MQKNYLQMYFDHSSCWRNQSEIIWSLLKQCKVVYSIGTDYGNYLCMRRDNIKGKSLYAVISKIRFCPCLFSSIPTILLTSYGEWSYLCLYLPSLLHPWETLFTQIILFNEETCSCLRLFSCLDLQWINLFDIKWINFFFKCDLSNTCFNLPYLDNCSFPIASFKNKNPYNLPKKKRHLKQCMLSSLDKLLQHMLKLSWRPNLLSMESLSPRSQ